MVRNRSVTERLARGQAAYLTRAAAEVLSPDVLLGSASCPMQLVIAGKAHPKDEEAKRMVCRPFEYRDHPGFASRIVFLEDYHLRLGAALPRAAICG